MDNSLHALSPYDGRYAKLGEELAPWFSEAGLIQARVIIEIQYLMALSRIHVIRTLTVKEKQLLSQYTHLNDASLEKVKKFEKTTNHDVQAVVVFLREEFSKTSLADSAEYIHFGLTSEDVNNLSWRLNLVSARDSKLIPIIDGLTHQLAILAEKYKALSMLARTHGQPAIPTTFGKELINVVIRLYQQRKKLVSHKFFGKSNGAVGNYTALSYSYPSIDWISFSDTFIKSLGLEATHFTTQVNPNDDIIEYLQIVERMNIILHSFASDMWRYISDDLIIQKPTGVGSSTMPQKINPIHFEHSEGVTEIANGLIGVLVTRLGESRLQRDLSDTPLFRFLGEIHATTIDALQRITYLLSRIYPNEVVMHTQLWHNWVILAEPLQLILRKAGVKDGYAVVKKYTQGKKFDETSWKKLLDNIVHEYDISDKNISVQLQQLSPDTYLGKAANLVDLGLKELQKKDGH